MSATSMVAGVARKGVRHTSARRLLRLAVGAVQPERGDDLGERGERSPDKPVRFCTVCWIGLEPGLGDVLGNVGALC